LATNDFPNSLWIGVKTKTLLLSRLIIKFTELLQKLQTPSKMTMCLPSMIYIKHYEAPRVLNNVTDPIFLKLTYTWNWMNRSNLSRVAYNTDLMNEKGRGYANL